MRIGGRVFYGAGYRWKDEKLPAKHRRRLKYHRHNLSDYNKLRRHWIAQKDASGAALIRQTVVWCKRNIIRDLRQVDLWYPHNDTVWHEKRDRKLIYK